MHQVEDLSSHDLAELAKHWCCLVTTETLHEPRVCDVAGGDPPINVQIPTREQGRFDQSKEFVHHQPAACQ